jgi:hypothetical protein
MYWLNVSKLDFKMHVNVWFKLNEPKPLHYELYGIKSELNVQFWH